MEGNIPLLQDGVATLRIPGPSLSCYVNEILLATREYIDPSANIPHLSFPIDDNHPPVFVMGGFGAMSTASSFHSTPIRALRSEVYAAVKPWLAKAHPGKKIELLFDRFSARRTGTSTTKESWHRDLGNKQPGDVIYGGWVNMDPMGTLPQRFSGIKGTFIPADTPNPDMGLSSFSDEDAIGLEQELKHQGTIPVYPNDIILFDQSIAHKFTPSKAKQTSFRCYFGWRITTHDEPLYDKDSIINGQTVPPLPSGEPALMYAKLHWVNWKPLLMSFSGAGFLQECFDTSRPGYISRSFPGLVAMGIDFEPYTPAQRALFFPHTMEETESSSKRRCL